MAQCRRRCPSCRMTVTVLVESRRDCVAFGKVAEAFMAEQEEQDISFIFRVEGLDVLTRCNVGNRLDAVEECLF